MSEFNPWQNGPPWAADLRHKLWHIICQNEAILAKLENRESHLSPEDQAKLNRIFDTTKADAAKIDAAVKK